MRPVIAGPVRSARPPRSRAGLLVGSPLQVVPVFATKTSSSVGSRGRATRPRARPRRAPGPPARSPPRPLELDQERAVLRRQRLAPPADRRSARSRPPSAVRREPDLQVRAPDLGLERPGVPRRRSRPMSMIPTRSASWSASSRYWVVRKTVVPSRLSFLDLLPDRLAAHGVEARWSARRGTGPAARGRARRRGRGGGASRPSRCRPGDRRRSPARPGRAASRRAPSLGAREPVERRLEVDQLAAGHQRVERRLLERDADRARTSPASATTSCPATRALPPVGRSSVVSIRTVVVLPAPLGPRKA